VCITQTRSSDRVREPPGLWDGAPSSPPETNVFAQPIRKEQANEH
jgi:hypothetical protein